MVTERLIKAHRLAQHICVVHAKQLRDESHKRFREPWHHYYDPLAATVLGDLIYTTMTGIKDRT